MNEQEIDNLIAEVDYQGTGKVNYSEFIAATLDIDLLVDEKKLLAVISQFDTDSSGYITKENIRYGMQKLSLSVEDKEI